MIIVICSACDIWRSTNIFMLYIIILSNIIMNFQYEDFILPYHVSPFVSLFVVLLTFICTLFFISVEFI